MGNITITDIDTGKPCIDGVYTDESLTLAGASTVKPGTILARHTGTLRLQLYVKGGSSNGNGIPVAIMPYELIVTASGNFPVRAMSSGKVIKERLVIAADGDGSNVDNTVLDLLRAHSIEPEAYEQLGVEDNEPGES